MPFTLRPARLADAPALGALHHQVWRAAYGPLVPPSVWRERLVEHTVARWTRTLTHGPSAHPWLAFADGAMVGFAAAGPAPADAVRERELQALYVHPAAQGSGVADELLAAALGPGPAFLWVAEDNPRARAFYRRHGFRADGARASYPLTAAVALPVMRMVR